jgi:hypothetical protein
LADSGVLRTNISENRSASGGKVPKKTEVKKCFAMSFYNNINLA